MLSIIKTQTTRIVYFLMGGYAIAEGFSTSETLFIALGLLLVGQAVFNLTCMGGACRPPRRSHTNFSEK